MTGKRGKYWALVLVMALMALMGGCGGDGENGGEQEENGDVDGEADGDGDGEQVDGEASEDLGRECNLVCNYSPCVEPEEGCDGGLCVRHGELNASYCTQPCVESCVPGYSCVTVEDGEYSVCLSDEPECGNGAVEFGEVCDGEEGCSADCKVYTEPVDEEELSGGTITEAVHGNEPGTTSGLEPEVVAHNMDGRLYFSAQGYGFTYGMNLPEAGTEVPTEMFLEAGLLEEVGGNICQFNGSAMAAITTFDFAAQEIAGEASMTMVCMGYCDPCTDEFPLEVSFELEWVDVEE